MSGSDNLSGRLYLRAKELASSSIGFSGSIIFLTLSSLGIIFGIRIQLQPPSNEEISVFDRTNDSPNTSIEDANFTKESSKKFTATEIENNNESRPSRLSANSQNDLETGALDSASVDQVKNSIDLNQSSESLQKYSEFIEVDEKLKKTLTPIKLTVDKDIQYLIRRELIKFNEIFKSKGSAAILMNVNNGEILS